ncbi:hypothetical protein ACFX1X_002470 [Malus domestica]
MYNIDQLPDFGSRLDPVQFGEPLNRVRTSIFACALPMERIYQSNPSKFEYLYSLVNHDVKTNTLFKSTSVSLVWLTRYMDFLVELFRNLREHPPNWLGSKYAPEKDLLKVIGGNGDVMGDMEKFCTSFTSLLKQNHEFLAGMDDLKLFRASLVAKVPSTYPKQRKMGKTMFAPALEELESVKSESKEILTKHFLESCNKILPIIAEFGNVVYPVTFNIRTCVVRLQYRYSSEAMVMSQEF